MNYLQELSISLTKLQDNVIGIVELYGHEELIVSNTKHTITSVTIGTLGGLQTTVTPKEECIIHLFPDKYKSLTMFLNDPTAFSEWYTTSFKD